MRQLNSPIALLFIFLCTFSHAQEDKTIPDYAERLRTVFDTAQLLVYQQSDPGSTDSSLIAFITRMNSTIPVDHSGEEQLYIARQNLLRKQTGLSYSLDANQNFNPNQQDLEDNILYQRRLQNGVEWNILKDGFVDARNELKAIELEKELRQLVNSRSAVQGHPEKKGQLVYWFDQKKAALLRQRANLLGQQYRIVTELYFEKKITKDVLLGVQARVVEAQALQEVYSLYRDYLRPVFDSAALNWQAPLFDLNYETLMGETGIAPESADTLLLSLLDRIEQQNKWFNEIRLKAYVRHSYYDLVNPGSRAFFSAGLGVNIPLTFSHREQNALEREKVIQKVGQVRQDIENLRIDLLNDAYEYRLRLKNYIVLNQRRVLVLEDIRRERVKENLEDPGFNPLHGLELVDDLCRIELELLDLKQDLYLRLVRIHERMKTVPVSALIAPIQLANSLYREETKQPIAPTAVSSAESSSQVRVVTVPVSLFDKHPPEFLMEYVLYNEFNEVQIEIPPGNKWTGQQAEYIQSLHEKGVKIDLVISNPGILQMNRTKMRSEIVSVLAANPLAGGIHLAPEANLKQAVPQDKIRRQAWEELIKEARSVCDSLGKTLSIDLSPSADTAFAGKIFKQADKIWLESAYPLDKTALINQLQAYGKEQGKLVIVLRTDHFSTRSEMEELAGQLVKETGVRTISYRDLERLIELDRKSVEPVSAEVIEPVITAAPVTKFLPVVEEISTRNIYVWSKTFLSFPAEVLSNYVQDNNFTGVQLAVTRNDDQLQAKTVFLNRMHAYNIQTDLMFGQNSLLNLPPAGMHTEIVRILSGYPLQHIHGIHLDVEPHTRKDWKSNQDSLKQAYKALVREARIISDSLGFKLSADLPLTLDNLYVQEILEQTDMIRFMCYENTRTNYLLRKLRPFLEYSDKLSIALRTEDFGSRVEMEDFAKKLQAETGIKSVNFHDLGRLMALDGKLPPNPEKTVKKEEKEEPAADHIDKNVYIWTKTFGFYPVKFLADYIDTNGFGEVQLAVVRGDVYLEEKKAFMKALSEQHVKIDLMFAQKQILNIGSAKMRLEMSQTIARYPLQYVQGIHLDIEPHTRRDWRRNPEGLKRAYTLLLDEARFICDSLKMQLSVDIPWSYDAAFVKTAMRKADVVRFLCYQPRKRTILRKLKPYLQHPEKLAIALRTEDFRDRASMEALAKELSIETGITTINFHDLRNLIEFDR